MSNGTNRLFQVMKKTSESTNITPSQVISLTVKSTQPLIFMRDDRLEITEEFCTFNKTVTPESLKVGDLITAFVFNGGQKYFIQQNNSQSGIGGNYNDLMNKPSINGVELIGNKSSNELNLATLNNSLRQTTIPINIGPVTGWYLALSGGKLADVANDNFSFTLLISQIYSQECGILHINIRNDNGTFWIANFKWLANSGLQSENFKLNIVDNKYYLYVKVPITHGKYNIRVLEEHTLDSHINYDLFTFNYPTAYDTIDEPEGINPTESHLPITGGTLTGNITYNMYGTSWVPFEVYGGAETATYGLGLKIGAGGSTIIGSGESAETLKTEVEAGSERLYLISDTYIGFYTNAQTYGNKTGMYLNSDCALHPMTSGTGFIGTVNYPWNWVYTNNLKVNQKMTYGSSGLYAPNGSGIYFDQYGNIHNQRAGSEGGNFSINSDATICSFDWKSGVSTFYYGISARSYISFANGGGTSYAGICNSSGVPIIRDHNNKNVTVDATGGTLFLGFQNTTGLDFFNGSMSMSSTQFNSKNIQCNGWLVVGGTLRPNGNNSYTLGNSSNYWSNGYITKLYFNELVEKDMNVAVVSGDSTNSYFGTGGGSSGKTTNLRGNTVRLYAHSGGGVYLGSSGSTAVTSDENLKDIYEVDSKYIDFFNKLKPINYVYKQNGHRKHFGFGARQVEQALLDSGLTTEDFAGVLKDKDVTICADENGTGEDIHYDELYSLRYEEFVSLNTLMIQKAFKELNENKNEINSLKGIIKELQNKINSLIGG